MPEYRVYIVSSDGHFQNQFHWTALTMPQRGNAQSNSLTAMTLSFGSATAK
jgi:hypothetical protein